MAYWASIFSIATVFFGQLVSTQSNDVSITPVSPTSFTAGRAFDQFVIITLENQALRLDA